MTLRVPVFLAATIWATAAQAEISLDTISPDLPPSISIGASLRTRWEMWNWFETPQGRNNDYDFVGTVLRASGKWKSDWADVLVEGQSSGLIDLPTTASGPAPQGNLGLGGVYFQTNRRRHDASPFLKQGFVNWKQFGIPGLTARGGRFEFAEGNEVLSGDASVDWIKNMRLSQRLIGGFGWSHVGRAFDGVAAAYNRSPFNVTMMLSHPTAGGFDLNGMHELDDVDLAYTSANWTKLRADSTTDARLFYVYYDDRRHQAKTDNRPATARNAPAERQAEVQIHTIGAHAVHVIPTAAGSFDGYVWGVGQVGDWGVLNHAAWAWSGEVGWQPPSLPWKPWLRAGYARSSGDDDAKDGTHHTFFQILPTARIYSFSTFYNLMNTEDASVELLLRPKPGLVSRTEFHNLRLTEANDLWYQGSGATIGDRNRAEGFGYSGRPGNGFRELFSLLQTSLSYDWSAFVNTNVYYAHVVGGEGVQKIFASDEGDFGYIEITLKI